MSELGDLLELLYGAHSRWRTVRLVVRDWSHNERSRAVFERRIERMKGQGKSLNRVSFYAPGSRPPRHEATEQTTRIWLDGDRSREEADRQHGTTVVVHDGDTWCMTSPHDGATTNDGNPVQHAGSVDAYVQMLDPADLSAAFELEPQGTREVAGRRGIAVRAVPRPREHPLRFYWQLLDADEVQFVVDAQRGVVLRVEAFVDGEPYYVRELVEIAFDETFPLETFRIDLPPGESFKRMGADRHERLTLAEAAARASFPVFAPGKLADGWQLSHATHISASERPAMHESVHLGYGHFSRAYNFSLIQTTVPHPWLDSDELRTVERKGVVVKVLDPGEEDHPMPRHVLVERDGTHVNLSSQNVPLDELIEIGASLIRASDSPPPAVER